MTERQSLIAHKQAFQAAKNKWKQMPGIEVLELFGLNENFRLNQIFFAYSYSYYT